MVALVRLALAEYFKAYARRTGTSSARDFLWLTFFFALSSWVIFVGFSARQGLGSRFQQVLLGALPDSTPPIRVTYPLKGLPTISPDIVRQFEKDFPSLSLVPAREYDGQAGVIHLPGLEISDNAKPAQFGNAEAEQQFSWAPGPDGVKPDFKILALPLSSPIWKWIGSKARGQLPELHKKNPTVVAASKSLFSKFFRYAKYREALVNDARVPCLLRDATALPDVANKTPDDLTEIVLEVRERRDLPGFQAFKIVWVESFPLPDQVALIVPLETAEVLETADELDNLHAHLEAHGAPSRRLRSVSLRDIENDPAGAGKFRALGACLGAVPAGTSTSNEALGCGGRLAGKSGSGHDLADRPPFAPRMRETYDFTLSAETLPMMEKDVATCARRAGLPDLVGADGLIDDGAWNGRIRLDTAPAPLLNWVSPGRVGGVPCELVSSRQSGVLDCDDPSGIGVAKLRGYRLAMIYSRPEEIAQPSASMRDELRTTFRSAGDALIETYRQSIAIVAKDGQLATTSTSSVALDASAPVDAVVEALLNWKPEPEKLQVFWLDPSYESALTRFGVLTTLKNSILGILGFALLLLYLLLCYVMLATTFSQRKNQYGLLTMAGFGPGQIVALVYCQIVAACVVGGGAGFLVFAATVNGVNWRLSTRPVIQKAEKVIGLDMPAFLDTLTAPEVLLLWLVMTVLTLLVGASVLRSQGISTAKAPVDLIKL